ncbi:hypothetical protein EXU48_07095 [Occultella glacieicola]|uniref:DUF1772 domain-containing protein n=1 Tax=Occultella glacieicola TaxID=2518684 RepID=A0ABY2E6A4_9MICO|nr:hypothetical protein [Occultella glacieicola]TDE96004.1 hypothetical protein EXU48_07095 [Occultella glacieicola]
MRFVAGLVAGLLAGTVYVLTCGLLAIRAEAVRAGAIVDLDNQIVAITDPRFPILPFALSAAAGAAMVYGLVYRAGSRRSPADVGLVCGALVACVSLIAWSATSDADHLARPASFAVGWEGWVQFGGRSQAVHLVTVLLGVTLVRALWAVWQLREARGESGSEASRDAPSMEVRP